MGRSAGGGAGEDPRSVVRPHAEPLAPLSDSRLPGVGARVLLPGERSVRFSRSAPGRHGADRGGPGRHARARGPRGGPTISRRRRPALVASALGPRRPDAHLGRSGLAPLRDCALHGGHGRRDGSRRADPLHRRPGAARREPRSLLRADGLGSAGLPLRALRPRARPKPGDRQSRPAADRDRKSTRLNSSHSSISYAVFCLKKKKKKKKNILYKKKKKKKKKNNKQKNNN